MRAQCPTARREHPPASARPVVARTSSGDSESLHVAHQVQLVAGDARHHKGQEFELVLHRGFNRQFEVHFRLFTYFVKDVGKHSFY